MPSKRSRVHPNYKTKYRVGNWPSYDASLVQRGNLNIWISPDAIKNWNTEPRGRSISELMRSRCSQSASVIQLSGTREMIS